MWSALKVRESGELIRVFCRRGPLYRDLLLPMVDSAGRGGDIGELSRGIVLLVVVVVVAVVSHSAQSRPDRTEGKKFSSFFACNCTCRDVGYLVCKAKLGRIITMVILDTSAGLRYLVSALGYNLSLLIAVAH